MTSFLPKLPNRSNVNYTMVDKHADGEDDLLILFFLGSIIDSIDTSWPGVLNTSSHVPYLGNLKVLKSLPPWVWLHKINRIFAVQAFPFITLSNACGFFNNGSGGDHLSLPNADYIVLWIHVVQTLAIEKR